MTNGDKHLSQKSLGKRPAVDAQNLNTPARPKRVLPSRSRRGGPGIGGHDLDAAILDAQKRKFENEATVPAKTVILMTTNSKLASSSSTSDFGPNDSAYERYFDRPEVSEAYKKQQTIETPEFSLLSEDASVGGRFRPRALEDELADTSDATYEKRHRKYETFEKRQRFREKEKLKHEQYKLKERIEQLRGMDGAAFLLLPAALFSGSSKIVDDNDPGIQDLPGIHVNGAALYNEGERRRKMILETAASLEERYRVLLPPDRTKVPEKEKRSTATPRASAGPDSGEVRTRSHDEETEVKEAEVAPMMGKLKLKIKFPALEASLVDAQDAKVISLRRHSSGRWPVTPISRPRTRSFNPESPALINETTTTPDVSFEKSSSSMANAEYIPSSSSPKTDISHRKRARRDTGVSAPVSLFEDQAQEEYLSDEEIDARGSDRRTLNGFSDSTGREIGGGVLLSAAFRSSFTGRKTQRTQRHVTAFGMKLHPELEEVRDFEIPDWIKQTVHIMDDMTDIPPEAHPTTWFADKVNGGPHFPQRTHSVSELQPSPSFKDEDMSE